jgi:hypothetical protein
MTTLNLFNDIINENITKDVKITYIHEDTHHKTNDGNNNITTHGDDSIIINSYSNSNVDSNNDNDEKNSNIIFGNYFSFP